MSAFEDHHKTYHNGVFTSKQDAQAVADYINRIFHNKFKGWRVASIAVEGKKGSFSVINKRLNRYWFPEGTKLIDLAQHLREHATELARELEEK